MERITLLEARPQEVPRASLCDRAIDRGDFGKQLCSMVETPIRVDESGPAANRLFAWFSAALGLAKLWIGCHRAREQINPNAGAPAPRA